MVLAGVGTGVPAPAVPLSVLDLAPVPDGSTPADALGHSLDLVRHAERLGFQRYWVAEHHNMPGIASSAPAVLLAHLAGVTSTIRLGSGGVMLPNHTPLVIAEQFGMLEAFNPGRIDLGIGRAPGTDRHTAQALRRSVDGLTVDEFPRHVIELQNFFSGQFPADHPYSSITAVPAQGYPPQLWLLGSSDYSAHLAGLLGLPFSFAHHFSSENTMPAIERYLASFRPSAVLDEPHIMLAVTVVCAETEDEARWHAAPLGLSFLRLAAGRPGLMPTPETAAAYPYSTAEQRLVQSRLASSIVGDPVQVRDQLEALVARTGTHELMITTNVHSFTERVRSYERVAAVWPPSGETTDAPERDAASHTREHQAQLVE